jgi:hypothetical protein
VSGSGNYTRTCHLPLKIKLTLYLHNDRNSLTCDKVSHLRRIKCSIRPHGQALSEPAHTVSLTRSASCDYGYCYSGQCTSGDDTVGRTVRRHTVIQCGLLRNHHGHLQIGGRGRPWHVLLVRANPPSLN